MAQIDAVLNEPFTAELLGGVSEIASGRFSVPPTAAAFLIDVDSEMVLGGLSPQGVIAGALSAQGAYLEPTIGQIWPR